MIRSILSFITRFFLIDNIPGESTTPENPVLDPTYNALGVILPVAIGIILLCGTLYAVAIGVQYSRAEDADKRGAAKKKLINAIIGFGIVLVLLSILYAIRGPLGNLIDSGESGRWF